MNCHYIKFPLTCFLDAAKRFGFREIELFGAMPHFFLDDVDGLLVEQVICECQKRGLKLSSFCPAQGAYPMNIAIDEEPIRRRTVRMLKKALRIAGKMGCETMLVSPGFGYHNQSREISWAHSRRSLEELADTAQENNVVITIEPHSQSGEYQPGGSADDPGGQLPVPEKHDGHRRDELYGRVG